MLAKGAEVADAYGASGGSAADSYRWLDSHYLNRLLQRSLAEAAIAYGDTDSDPYSGALTYAEAGAPCQCRVGCELLRRFRSV